MTATFHFSIGVQSLEKEVQFLTQTLGAKVTHQQDEYVNLEVCGVQMTLKPRVDSCLDDPDFHYGLNLSLKQFDQVSKLISGSNPDSISMSPHVVDAGTSLERKKMYLNSPSGYRIELKGYR